LANSAFRQRYREQSAAPCSWLIIQKSKSHYLDFCMARLSLRFLQFRKFFFFF
jgi:hypothetical protein